MAENENGPLFETRAVKGRFLFRLFAASMAVGIGFICYYRLRLLPVASGKLERWAWIGLFHCELWFSFYWFLTVICRWNPVYRFPHKNRLSLRYEKELPGVDIFVCTADPSAEPPSMVMNTVLSVMAYDYPPDKLNIYLSDDGASELTFYAMLEASSFSKQWLPFCKKFKVEPRSPEAYFRTAVEPDSHHPLMLKHWLLVKKQYEEAKMRVERKQIPEEIRKQHKEFREWNFVSSRNDHQTIFKMLIDGRHPNAVDAEGNVLPTLVYLAREKRPQFHHHFKAGAMNALLEFPGLDANGGPCYIGTGCFHRRDALCGKKYNETCKVDWKRLNRREVEENATVLEETCKVLASCSFEQNTQWGNEMGLKYGCPAEDIITGLSIQCRGWKSIYLNPERESFLGIAPTSLLTMLVQHKRWAEGHFQIFLSRYCSLLYGHNRIPLKLQLAYCAGNLWAANSLPTLYYVVVPCFCLLKDIPLFPKVSSPWVLPFAYVAIAHRAYSLGEFLWCGGTFQAWCNDQRMWLFKRTTSYFFALCDTILKLLGYSNPTFVITAKVADEDVSRRYEQELMEFGDSSPMFVVLASLAMLNLFSGFGAIEKLVFNADHSEVSDRFGLQILLCFLLVALNWPVYNAVFFRKDNGGMPAPVTYKSITFALLVSIVAMST
ncbi:cellulose synthase-like protein E1 isoform X3 [Gossypium australe]|uniref:Cellulose synthase-like protein E1 isoform X3 n=1 Tax=Gossypium australe TaxID=47621 RepID=A0A5B6WWX9_9ROSI|nr:cellulose synthase-like protein E1 isoform X3 [Gossypium australe]